MNTEQTMMTAEEKPSQIDIDCEELWQKVGVEKKDHLFSVNRVEGFAVSLSLINNPYSPSPQFSMEAWNGRKIFWEYFKSAKELKRIFTELIPTFEFSKFYGRILTPLASDIFFHPSKEYCHLVEGIKNIEMDYGQCPCCLEITHSKPAGKCDHHLCMLCEFKLKNTHCPMCRGCICGACEECNDDDCE